MDYRIWLVIIAVAAVFGNSLYQNNVDAEYNIVGKMIIAEIADEDEITQEKIDLLMKKEWQEVTCEVTMYTLRPKECGGKKPGHPAYGITTSGSKVLEGRTVAASKDIPFGTIIKIDGLKNMFVAEDRGGKIEVKKGRNKKISKIDVFTNDLDWAQSWGRKEVTCAMLLPKDQ